MYDLFTFLLYANQIPKMTKKLVAYIVLFCKDITSIFIFMDKVRSHVITYEVWRMLHQRGGSAALLIFVLQCLKKQTVQNLLYEGKQVYFEPRLHTLKVLLCCFSSIIHRNLTQGFKKSYCASSYVMGLQNCDL